MAAKLVAIPEVFTGDGKQSWSDWLDHFDSVADVNEWSADTKKKWIRARLTGRAATAFRRLPEADRATFDKIVAGFTKRFEPECRRELYAAEFQRRRKRRSEDWAAFGEDLKTLVERAYPTLQVEAHEVLALNHFLTHIEDQQLAFAVRQRAPITVDAAVACVLELDTYLDTQRREDEVVIATVGRMRSNRGGAGIWEKLLERMERLETQLERLEKPEAKVAVRRATQDQQKQMSRASGEEDNKARENESTLKQVLVGVVNCVRSEESQEQPCVRDLSGEKAVATVFVEDGTVCDFTAAVLVNEVPGRCMVDTGAAASILSRAMWNRVKVEDKLKLQEGKSNTVVGITGVPLELVGSTEIELEFVGLEKIFSVEVQVAESIPVDIIVGRDFLQENNCIISFGKRNQLEFVAEGTTVDLGCGQGKNSTIRSDIIPPRRKVGDRKMGDCSAGTLPMGVTCAGRTSQLGLVGASAALLKRPRDEACSNNSYQLEANRQRQKAVCDKKESTVKFHYLWSGPHIT